MLASPEVNESNVSFLLKKSLHLTDKAFSFLRYYQKKI